MFILLESYEVSRYTQFSEQVTGYTYAVNPRTPPKPHCIYVITYVI